MKNNHSKVSTSGLAINRMGNTETTQQPKTITNGITAAGLWEIQKGYRTVYSRRH